MCVKGSLNCGISGSPEEKLLERGREIKGTLTNHLKDDDLPTGNSQPLSFSVLLFQDFCCASLLPKRQRKITAFGLVVV